MNKELPFPYTGVSAPRTQATILLPYHNLDVVAVADVWFISAVGKFWPFLYSWYTDYLGGRVIIVCDQ